MAILLFATATFAAAQTGTLTVKAGTRVPYTISSTMDMTESVQGNDVAINRMIESQTSLTARKIARNKIDWVFDVSHMHMRMTNPIAGKPVDSSLKVKPMLFSTDQAGRLLAVTSLDPALKQAMHSPGQGNSMEQMFSPALRRTIKVGDSWEETRQDTSEVQEGVGGTMVVHVTTRYTYEGDVDTLNTKASRVRYETTSLSIDGSLEAQGAKMTIDGDGTGGGLTYYSLNDGLMLNSTANMQTSVRISMTSPQELIIPVTQKLSTTTVRK
ncbi:MAG TPA: hypothetical protein VHI13_20265 [Candidatus Kapabacteria bacterium]|nr:hypothetical protein [Candidatus Kapabacteria bacterium]